MTKKILILAPHTDDGELGCGGSIAKHVQRGDEVFYLALSCPMEELEGELKSAAAILGIQHVSILDYTIRHFYEVRQAILDVFVQLNRDRRPDIVYMPSVHDMHQDHSVVVEEGIRAFKHSTILSYELPWNHLTFNNQYYSIISQAQLRLKIDALKCYQTQADRDYMRPDFIAGLARVRGVQAGKRYAECFEIVRMIQSITIE